MKKNGYFLLVKNCENRQKCFIFFFWNCEDNNNKSGRGRKECKFYKELVEVYGYWLNVRFFVIISSVVGKIVRVVQKEILESELSLELEVFVF